MTPPLLPQGGADEIKLAHHFDVQNLTLASEEKVRAVTGAPVGFAGPVA